MLGASFACFDQADDVVAELVAHQHVGVADSKSVLIDLLQLSSCDFSAFE